MGHDKLHWGARLRDSTSPIEVIQSESTRIERHNLRVQAADAVGVKNKLEDPEYSKMLKTKYRTYYDTLQLHEGLYQAWQHVYVLAHSGLCIPESHWRFQKVTSENAEEEGWFGVMVKPTTYLDIGKDYVEVEVNMAPIPITVVFEGNDTDEERIKKLEKQLKNIWPQFKMPESWVTTNTKQGDSKNYQLAKRPKIERQTAVFPLDKFASLKWDIPKPPKWDIDNHHFELPEGFQKKYAGITPIIRFDLNPDECHIRGVSQTAESGTIKGMRAEMTLGIECRGFMRYPLEYALWATSATSLKNFNPTLFVNFCNAHVSYDCGEVGKVVHPPERVASLDSVLQINKEKEKRLGPVSKPHTNAEGFAILRNGHVVWLPKVNRVLPYVDLLKGAYDSKAKRIKPLAEVKGIPNQPIYLDWIQNKFTYTAETGSLILVDLNGAIPLDNVTIARYLDLDLHTANDTESWLAGELNGLQVAATDANLFNHAGAIDTSDYRTLSILHMLEFCYEKLGELTIGLFGSGMYKTDDRYKSLPDQVRQVIDKYQAEVMRIMKEIYSRFDTLPGSFFSKMYGTRLILELFLTYSRQRTVYHEALHENMRRNLIKVEHDPDEDVVIPNMPGLASVMPHQADVLYSMKSLPDNLVLSIEPGGGKTILYLAQACRLLAAGKVKRVLIVTPGNLVKNVIDEIHTISKGKLNPFPLRQRVLDRLFDNFGMYEDDIVKYIRAMPPNTIFVADYDFLRGKRDHDSGETLTEILYGEKWVPQWPNVELLRRCGFDSVTLDESQRIKNLDAQKTQATSVIAAETNFKTLSSGTIVTNTGADVLGQFAMLNPKIFGTQAQFARRYGLGQRNGVIAPAVGVSNMLVEDMRPYVMKVTKKRRDWAFLLPQINEQFFHVQMTEDQQKFYNALIEDAFDEIMKDPKLRKLMTSGNEEDAAKIEYWMKRYFAKCEIFLNAPDTERFMFHKSDAFRKNKDNQTSAKCKLINDLIEAHIHGGNVQGTSFKPDPTGKILIFCYNKDVGSHVFRNINRKSETLFYQAGDEEVLARFRTDPSIRILVANETTIREGFNLQMASRLIRVQTLWSPGEQEQGMSRVLRPDPRAMVQRSEINLDWVLCEKTIEIAKTARLISKIIDKAKFDEGSIPNNRAWMAVEHQLGLELIRMNLDAIKEFQRQSDLMRYFEQYAVFKDWEDKQFEASRQHLAKRLEKKYGRVIPIKDVAKMAMIEVVPGKDIAGSKQQFVPWVEGAACHDRWELGLTAVSLVKPASEDDEDDENAPEDDDDEDTEDQFVLEPGTLVITELGIGKVLSSRDKTASVLIPGFGKKRISKTMLFIPADEAKRDKLKKLLKTKGHTHFQPYGLPKPDKTDKTAKVPNDLTDDVPVEDDENEEDVPSGNRSKKGKKALPPETKKQSKDPTWKDGPKGKQNTMQLDVAIINGSVALYMQKGEGDASTLVNRGWRMMPTFLEARIKTWQGMVNLLAWFDKRGYKVPPQHKRNLQFIGQRLKTNSGHLMQTGPMSFKDVRNFIKLNHQVVTDKKTILPWPLVWDNDVYVFINSHTQSFAVQALESVSLSGVTKFTNHAPLTVQFFPTKQAALAEVENLRKHTTITNYAVLIDEIKEIKFLTSKAPTDEKPKKAKK